MREEMHLQKNEAWTPYFIVITVKIKSLGKKKKKMFLFG